MPKYIDANAFMKILTTATDGTRIPDVDCDNFPRTVSVQELKRLIYRMPPADVEEVRHGKWIYEGHHEMMGHAFQCSVCTRWMFTNSPEYVVEEYPYCHCGAKMETVKGLEED